MSRLADFKKIDALQQEINSRRPLDHNELSQIKEYYRIGLTYTSNALEGNSLTETETKIVLEEGITIGGKRLRDHFEAVGHSQAYDYMYALVQQQTVTEDDIKKLHHLFYFRIDEQQAGVYRKVKVFITGSAYPCPLPDKVPELMAQFINNVAEMKAKFHPVEVAARAHKDFVFIHPFVDGNGRVARLLMNVLLLSSGYTIAIIPPVERFDYIAALEKAHRDDSDFIGLIAAMVKETQRDYLRMFAE